MKGSNIKSNSFSLRGRVREGVLPFLIIFMVLASCSQKTFDSKAELMSHVMDAENGYTQTKSINGVTFSLTYRPTDMLVIQEMSKGMSKAAIDSLRHKYGQYLYFTLSLSKNNQEVLSSMVSSKNDFGAMVNQLAFGMAEKVHLSSQARDTVELLDYVYPREYGMSGATNMMFVYPREELLLKKEFFHFTIEDIGLKTGEIGFRIPTKAIENEPKLNLKV